MNSLTVNPPKDLVEKEKEKIHQIKNWVHLICRKKCTSQEHIYVSPFEYTNGKGELVQRTVICISENLPDGPVIQVPKSLDEISLGDLLSCYALINYCRNKDDRDSTT